jgi:hypothetical protein
VANPIVLNIIILQSFWLLVLVRSRSHDSSHKECAAGTMYVVHLAAGIVFLPSDDLDIGATRIGVS